MRQINVTLLTDDKVLCSGSHQVGSYLLVHLEGGLELQVVPLGQDAGEGGLVSAKAALPGLAEESIIRALRTGFASSKEYL